MTKEKLTLFLASLVLALLSVSIMEGVLAMRHAKNLKCDAFGNSTTVVESPSYCN